MISRRKFLKRSLILAAGTAFTSPAFLQRYGLEINRYSIGFHNLPPAFDGFKILHITDVHCGMMYPRDKVRKMVKIANSFEADVIACTGDYVVGHKESSYTEQVWNELKNLRASGGVYAVLGNHDHWTGFEESLKLMEATGFSIRHKKAEIRRKGQKVWVGGTGDLWEDELGLDKAFKGTKADDFKIVLAHNPDSIDTNFKTRIDLMLSGHTHGGQIRLPLIGPPIVPVNNKRYCNGIIDTARGKLFVSKGIGCSSFPFRINCYPELALLELKRIAE